MIITLFIVFTSKYLLKIFYGEENEIFLLYFDILIYYVTYQFFEVHQFLYLTKIQNPFLLFLSASIIAIIFSNIIIINFNITGMIAGLIFNQIIIFLIIRYYYRLNIHKRRARK